MTSQRRAPNQQEAFEMDAEPALLEGKSLSRYLRNCIELTQANKVTIKNAFDIKAIDHLISLSKATDKDEEKNAANFSLASMSLQASGKIYGFRVDSVYADTVRLAFELPKKRCSIEAGSTALNSEELEESSRIKRRRVLSSYLADEGANDSSIEIDHGLNKNVYMNAVQGFGNAMGRLISYNLIPPETEGIDLEGSSPWWSRTCLERKRSRTPVHMTREYRPLMIETVQLNFDVPPAPEIKTEDSESVFDVNEDNSPILEDIAPLEMGDSEDETVEEPQLDRPGEFSLIFENSFKPSQMNLPGSSKFCLKRYDIHGTEKKSRAASSKKKDLKRLSLRDCTAELDEIKPKTPTMYREQNTLSICAMEKWSENDNVLEPPNSSFDCLTQLFAFPNWRNYYDGGSSADNHCQEEPTKNSDETGVDCTFDHSGDIEDRFADIDLEADDTRPDSGFDIPMSQPGEDRRFDDLICAPGFTVENLHVPYSKTARTLNMRQMQKSFWTVLTDNRCQKGMAAKKSFRAMYREVSPLLSEMNRKNINIPIAFVASLSLCNGKHLELTREHNDSEDFFLSQAPIPVESLETNSSSRAKRRSKTSGES